MLKRAAFIENNKDINNLKKKLSLLINLMQPCWITVEIYLNKKKHIFCMEVWTYMYTMMKSYNSSPKKKTLYFLCIYIMTFFCELEKEDLKKYIKRKWEYHGSTENLLFFFKSALI